LGLVGQMTVGNLGSYGAKGLGRYGVGYRSFFGIVALNLWIARVWNVYILSTNFL